MFDSKKLVNFLGNASGCGRDVLIPWPVIVNSNSSESVVLDHFWLSTDIITRRWSGVVARECRYRTSRAMRYISSHRACSYWGCEME